MEGHAVASKNATSTLDFFVTDRILAGELNVSYCPTLNMIGDYVTKPLQDSLFRKFRNTIIGIPETDIPRYIRLAKLAWTAQQTLNPL